MTQTPVLIVGLGNVGDRYAKTRHNVGFMVIEALATKLGAIEWRNESKFKSELTEVNKDGTRIFLAKPQTMMNGSGQAVIALMNFYKISPDRVWVISDDVDLDFGSLRVRAEGSSGGQQGLASIIEAIGTGFNRLRFGIGDNRVHNLPSEDYVMQSFNKEETEQLPKLIDQAVEQLSQAITNK